MKTRCVQAVFGVVLVALLAPAAESDVSVFMWKAQKDGAVVHLLGSIHALREDAYPLPEVIEAAFAQSDVVVFEIDLDEMTAAAVQMLSEGSLGEGQTLEKTVGPDLWSRFNTKMNAAGMPSGMFQFMKPWMAALTLMSFELERAGYSPASGIDTHLWHRAGADGKDRVALESVDFQVGLFTGLTPEESRAFLEYTLADLETVIPLMDELAQRWRTGDAAFVREMMGAEFEEYPDLYEKLISGRNQAWMPAIEELLQGGRDAIVVVGAMHLVGDDGIVEMLRQKGYTVTQL